MDRTLHIHELTAAFPRLLKAHELNNNLGLRGDVIWLYFKFEGSSETPYFYDNDNGYEL